MSTRYDERMSTAHRLTTADELLGIPDDGYRYDLVRGELRKMSAAGFRHGAISLRFGALLMAFVESEEAGIVVGAETGFVLSENPDTVLAPDVAFVHRSRIPSEGLPDRFFPGPPDLAVEVVSPGDRPKAIAEKVAEYHEGGTRIVVIVDPKSRSVTVHRTTGPERFESASVVHLEDLLPGFGVPVDRLFE
jgi:Uma2 family endonuclease